MMQEQSVVQRFPKGQFKEGDSVRLRQPEGHNLFDNPRGVLQVVAVNWFRTHEPPTYAVQEPGGIAITPFGDDDLCLVDVEGQKAGAQPGTPRNDLPAVDHAEVEAFLLSLFTPHGLARSLRDEHFARAAKLLTQMQGKLPEHLAAWRESIQDLDRGESQWV